MHYSITTLIFLFLDIAVNLFGGIFLLASSGKEFLNRKYLAFFFLNSALLFFGHFLSYYEYWTFFKVYDPIFIASVLAFYPFYYLYLKSAFHGESRIKGWQWHFLPSVVMGGSMAVLCVMSSNGSYYQYMQANVYSTPTSDFHALMLFTVYIGTRVFYIVQTIGYIFVGFRFLRRAKREMQDEFSNMDKFQLKHFNIVNYTLLFLMGLPSVIVTIVGRYKLTNSSWTIPIIAFVFICMFTVLGIIGFTQKPVIRNFNEEDDDPKVPENDCDDRTENCYPFKEDFHRYFNEQKPWLDPNLNIWQVSQAIGVNRTYVSNYINSELNCNFNAFVNQFRIEFSKDLLKNATDLNMEDVAAEAGFGSLSSFKRAFSAAEGLTPKAYRDQQ